MANDYKETDSGLLVPSNYRIDAWFNNNSGMGDPSIDKTMGTTFSGYGSVLAQNTLRSLYRYDWLSRKICMRPAKDATRKFIQYKDEDIQKAATEKYKDIKLRQKIKTAIAWSRLTGGAGIVMITNQDPLTPLSPTGEDTLVDIEVYDRWELNPVAYDLDYTSVNYMKPIIYETYTGKQFHYTRVCKFQGAELTREDMRSELYWGGSIVETVWSAIKHLQATYEDVRYILTELNIGILSIPNLTIANAQTGKGGAKEKVQKRVDAFNLTKSNQRVAAIDKEEEFTFVNRTVTGVNELMEQFKTAVAAATDGMNELVLFGESPDGFGGSQAEMMATYYDTIEDIRQDQIAPCIDQINAACGWEDAEYTFESLWEMSDTDKATVMANSAAAVAPLINTLLTPEEAIAQLNSLGVWNIDDSADVPDLFGDDDGADN